jgi:hypothetical protein
MKFFFREKRCISNVLLIFKEIFHKISQKNDEIKEKDKYRGQKMTLKVIYHSIRINLEKIYDFLDKILKSFLFWEAIEQFSLFFLITENLESN